MPGLLDEEAMAGGAAPPGRTPPAQMTPESETVPDEQGEQASPEEQEAYEEFVKTGYELMYKGGEVNPKILKMLDDDPSDLMAVLDNAEELKQFTPVVALGATAAIITLEACRKTGEKNGAVILHGGKALLEDLVEIAGRAGVRDYSEEEMGQAMHVGADLFRHAAEAEGLVNADEAKAEWGEITAADKEGRLGEVIPQFAGVQEPPMEAAPDG